MTTTRRSGRLDSIAVAASPVGRVLNGLSLALIGNGSAEKCRERAGWWAEAFSIRRLEVSRWRLRRTRELWLLNCNPFDQQNLAV